MSVRRRRLGRSDLEVSPIGLGCWQFSEGKGFGGIYWPALPDEEVRAIVRASLAGGIDWFDTAEIYGNGHSEQALARALHAAGKQAGDVVVATKWWPVMRTASNLRRTIDERLRCLDGYGIDLYQVHQPVALATVTAQMDAMADLVARKKIRSVGVSNFSARRMRAAHAALARHGIPLVSNQVRYNMLDRRIEANGTLAAAKELDIAVIAYSPLAQGILSGKFHDDPSLAASRPGPRRFMRAFRARGLAESRPLVEELRRVAAAHGATPSQVALAWLLQFHGDVVVAIPGATKERHVADNVGAMSLTLSPEELGKLDVLSRYSK